MIEELERRIQSILRGQSTDLRVIGAGEICVVVAWPPEQPCSAMKRLPPHDAASLTAYAESIAEYEAALRSRGIAVAPCEFETHAPLGARSAVLYLKQPLYQPSSLLVEIARSSAALPPGIDQVLDAIGRIDERLGLDAQLSNWVDVDGVSHLIDTSTPFMRDDAGTDRMDVSIVLRPFPAVVRPVLRSFVVPGLLDRYHQPRAVALDLVANLIKERLDTLVEPLCERIGASFGEPITPEEVRNYYRSDARLWSAIQSAKRSQRWWERTIRRRTYPFLIPDRLDRSGDDAPEPHEPHTAASSATADLEPDRT